MYLKCRLFNMYNVVWKGQIPTLPLLKGVQTQQPQADSRSAFHQAGLSQLLVWHAPIFCVRPASSAGSPSCTIQYEFGDVAGFVQVTLVACYLVGRK